MNFSKDEILRVAGRELVARLRAEQPVELAREVLLDAGQVAEFLKIEGKNRATEVVNLGIPCVRVSQKRRRWRLGSVIDWCRAREEGGSLRAEGVLSDGGDGEGFSSAPLILAD